MVTLTIVYKMILIYRFLLTTTNEILFKCESFVKHRVLQFILWMGNEKENSDFCDQRNGKVERRQ